MGNIIKQTEYGSFLNEIKARIRAAQYEALKAVNKELITLYWDIGRMIVDRQDKQGWGKSVIQNLAVDLQKEFQGTGGFSAAGLWRMRNFYRIYKEKEKLAPMVREIQNLIEGI